MSEGMLTVSVASTAFAVGGGRMKLSDGFSRIGPSVAVAVLFVAGAALLARAVQLDGLTMAYLVGLGLEAIGAAAIGTVLFSEQVTVTRTADWRSSAWAWPSPG
jgi:multidrug transporter EmrE-like cation transporter